MTGTTVGVQQVTMQMRAVAAAIRDGHNWGTGITEHTGVSTQVVYPMLARMRQSGWVTWEQEPAHVAARHGRPQRTLYALTCKAVDALGFGLRVPRPRTSHETVWR
ncbi:DNA-binding PadR family transcriptional regulator [Actinoplanes lutulentus]|uniref:PadR family transcriptional regulator n=1 Tax=Actinoplanes lutulentus TaxID=1287878 RepID=A0A327YY06_9ACTN|nr:hypothetical protein [Actinoplanes lutulentus]MBB2940498.1 DNA-binding PadR family transcriptional regulator [Actinoplanes lutulentus]RAK25480.1 hypothetical protein B0I29_13319 [Actinoplanes lutulentus]